MTPIECVFSPCQRYRYIWQTKWDTRPPCVFIGLNPSTADLEKSDPTVRRCMNYAERWGYGALVMLNLFAFRATDPKDMKQEADPVGPLNGQTIRDTCGWATIMGGLVVAAWGVHGVHNGQAKRVRSMLGNIPLYYLKMTKAGEPGHPLYLKGYLTPTRWV